jgi:hypothetical protein
VQGTITYKELNDDIVLLSVQYDIAQVLEAYEDCFDEGTYALESCLHKLDAHITTFREKPKHKHHYIATALIITALFIGFMLGRYNTIHNAEVHNITDNGYEITFGNETHNYTFN